MHRVKGIARAVKALGKEVERVPAYSGRKLLQYGRMLGPGLIAGGADDDAGGIATYSIVGATTGYALAWLLLLSTPMLIAVQGICAKIGDVTQKGLSTLIRENYGVNLAYVAMIVLVIANLGCITADVTGMSIALQLFTGISWMYFIVPLSLIVLYVIIFQNFKSIMKVLIYLSLVLLAYVVTAFLANPNWGTVLAQTLTPQITFSTTFLAAAVGLLGTTITPYMFFWQTSTEIEAKRTVKSHKRVDFDIFAGMIYSNLISYFIIISTGAVLYPHLKQLGGASALNSIANPITFIPTALQPLAGPYAFILFGIGLFAASVLAVSVMSTSTAYVVCETMGWEKGLNKKLDQARGFYAVISASVLIAAGVMLAGVNAGGSNSLPIIILHADSLRYP
jgi:NRAMP (natural resistance-associated macrophage protein)-like metal ion transporter